MIEANRFAPMAVLAALSSLLPITPARGQENPPSLRAPSAPAAAAPGIKLLISLSQPFVAEPDAARIRLHILNPSQQPVWLYRRARAKQPPVEQVYEENRSPETTGGSTVEVKLEPVDAQAARPAASPAVGTVPEYVNMPKPRLVKLAADGDYEEVSIVRMQPAMAEGQKPIWGAYRLTVVYAATFSNGDEFQRNLGATLWQGEVASNTIPIELRAPLPTSVGTLSGTTLGPELHALSGIRVSLSDEQGQLIDQQVTGMDGQFSFAHLPLALYWVTGRRENATVDTVTFHHEELSSAAPSANTQLVLYPPEIYEAKKMVHKPALFRVFDSGGRPAGGIDIDAVFSNGDALDDVKATTGDDGSAAVELLPGRNSVSLKRHGCADQVERADVAQGKGVEDFKMIFDCTKK